MFALDEVQCTENAMVIPDSFKSETTVCFPHLLMFCCGKIIQDLFSITTLQRGKSLLHGLQPVHLLAVVLACTDIRVSIMMII